MRSRCWGQMLCGWAFGCDRRKTGKLHFTAHRGGRSKASISCLKCFKKKIDWDRISVEGRTQRSRGTTAGHAFKHFINSICTGIVFSEDGDYLKLTLFISTVRAKRHNLGSEAIRPCLGTVTRFAVPYVIGSSTASFIHPGNKLKGLFMHFRIY